MEHIIFSIAGQMATIQLNRPQVYNSINKEVAFAIQRCLKECEQNKEIRAVVLRGSGKAFSAGQDLKEASTLDPDNISEIINEQYNPIIESITTLEKPVVAAINGVAAGAGLNIALACDLVVAKHSAMLFQGFGKIGLIPDCGGTYIIPRLIGLQRAKAFMFLNEPMSAEHAENIGLIYKAVPDDAFDSFVEQLVKRLSNMATRSIGLTKRALNHALENDFATQLGIEEQLQVTAGQTMDHPEGVQAFLEKREPKFQGK